MAVREVRAAGFEAVMLATALLQRAHRADPEAALWEAVDIQWAWRMPRRSDDVEKLFWIDECGPVAGILLTSWTDDAWQCDPVVVPGATGPEPSLVWQRAMEHVATHAAKEINILVRDNDQTSKELAQQFGFSAGVQESTAWMNAADRPTVLALSDGFALVDRTQRRQAPHPMQQRNGASVAQRLAQCPLYDPALDLAVETHDGRIAGYSLYWFDPTTKVGIVEPVRVEEEFSRQGLARAMLAAGIDRLATRGAQRVKVVYESDAAATLYRGVGFSKRSTATWFKRLKHQ